MTVGAMCKPSVQDGVLVSMGEATDGLGLYVREGVPRFAVRIGGALHEVPGTLRSRSTVGHVAGVIGAHSPLTVEGDAGASVAGARRAGMACSRTTGHGLPVVAPLAPSVGC
jgi:hypothetical protein